MPGGASMGMMGQWPSPDCVCNDFWQQTYNRTGVLEFSRDRSVAGWGSLRCGGHAGLCLFVALCACFFRFLLTDEKLLTCLSASKQPVQFGPCQMLHCIMLMVACCVALCSAGR